MNTRLIATALLLCSLPATGKADTKNDTHVVVSGSRPDLPIFVGSPAAYNDAVHQEISRMRADISKSGPTEAPWTSAAVANVKSITSFIDSQAHPDMTTLQCFQRACLLSFTFDSRKTFYQNQRRIVSKLKEKWNGAIAMSGAEDGEDSNVTALLVIGRPQNQENQRSSQ